MTGPARLREAPDVADAITQHRHTVGVQLGDENARLGFIRFRLDQHVGPINRVIERRFGTHLKGNVAYITPAVTFVNRATKGSRNLFTMIGQELFSARNKTARRIVSLIAAFKNMLSQMADGAG